MLALKRGQPVPDDGYHGEYVGDLARDLPEDIVAGALSEPERGAGSWASGHRSSIRGGIEQSLANLGVRIDVWKSEGSLHGGVGQPRASKSSGKW